MTWTRDLKRKYIERGEVKNTLHASYNPMQGLVFRGSDTGSMVMFVVKVLEIFIPASTMIECACETGRAWKERMLRMV